MIPNFILNTPYFIPNTFIFAKSIHGMQFKYPELLWALFLLLVPIIIHLFQLRRFKKTPFTNVKLLQKVVAKSRRSSTLKKWLLLLTRLCLIAALVLSFAQPFFANKQALAKKETVIYIDNSFSMQAKKDERSLLELAVQDLIKTIPKASSFSLFTNDAVYRDVTAKEIQNELLELQHSHKQLHLDEIGLKAQTLFSSDAGTIKSFIIISDFQDRIAADQRDSLKGIRKHLVQLRPNGATNIVVDTAYIAMMTPNSLELMSELRVSGEVESIPVSLFNGDKLIAKTAAIFDDENKASVQFTLPQNELIDGKIEITDAALIYDNQLYFNLNQKEKIKVLSIGGASDNFLARIYTEDEFDYKGIGLNSLNYSILEKQNLIVLNELPELPKALQNALNSFVSKGGSVAVIPSREINMTSYNEFLINYQNTIIRDKVFTARDITGIAFGHPLYGNVFEKKVTNFQYPGVSEYYRIQTGAPKILSYQDNTPFLVGTERLFLFTAALDSANSNFKNSPLVVPTLYSMATNSLKLPALYHQIGAITEVDVPVVITNDNILKVSQNDYEFIPQQHYFANKTSMFFTENPDKDGLFTITDGRNFVQNISFNNPREESEMTYLTIDNLEGVSKNDSITQLFGQIEKDNRITELWKWFVILALLFMLTEVLIQKLFK